MPKTKKYHSIGTV